MNAIGVPLNSMKSIVWINSTYWIPQLVSIGAPLGLPLTLRPLRLTTHDSRLLWLNSDYWIGREIGGRYFF